LAFLAGPGLLSATSMTPIGDAMFFSAGMMWAGFSILTKRWSISPLAATAVVSVFSALIYVPIHIVVFGWHQLLSSSAAMLVIQVLVQGVLSGVVAVIAFAKAIELIGPAKAAIFPAFVPAAALIIGIPMTGEVPTVLQTGGLCLVIAGLLFAIVSPSRALFRKRQDGN
jgi:drug/metabolite transporter (DMT)-like permease